jgi:hypothetical protein
MAAEYTQGEAGVSACCPAAFITALSVKALMERSATGSVDQDGSDRLTG